MRRTLDTAVIFGEDPEPREAERKVNAMEEIKELARQIIETADLALKNEEETPEMFDDIIITAEKIIELAKPPF